MSSQARWRIVAAVAALAAPAAASAHGFGRLYNLPVPFWLYAWGASGALLLSFLAAGYFLAGPGDRAAAPSRDLSQAPWLRALRRARVRPVLQALGVAALLLCIATGLFGNRDPFRNFSMTAFWIVFVLGFAWLCALIGDLYAAVNPWRVLAAALARAWRGYGAGRVRYPEGLGDWPALALYVAFIGYELFNHGRPSDLAAVLLGYTALNLAGAWLVGAQDWFRHCEFFSVFFRLLALMAPLEYRLAARAGEPGSLRLRPPLAGLARERPAGLGTLAFALAMLSTTAFDGLRATQWWVSLFWNDPTGVVTRLAGAPPVHAYALLRPWYIGWEVFWLVASPFVYLGAYLLAIALARALTRSARPLRELALDFGYTLLPIALVYSVTHYATLVLSEGVKIFSLLSDPFGWGWNLFGTAWLWRAPILPPMGAVWHTQVALILAGHVASVCVAHVVALRVFSTRRQALLSQLPMLALMVAFTVAGLWILAQPLTAVLMR